MARILENTGTAEFRVECELVIPPGASTIPLEFTGVVPTLRGEHQITRGHEDGTLTVRVIDDMDDRMPPPPHPPGPGDHVLFGVIQGEVSANDVLRVTAQGTESTIQNHRVFATPVANETTSANTTIYAPHPPPVGWRLRVSGLSTASLTVGPTTYRVATATRI